MKKKKSTALFLALLMIATVFLNGTSVFAEDEQEVPGVNQPVEKVQEVKLEDKKDTLEEVKANKEEKDSEKTEATEELKKDEGLEISKEEVSEVVSLPDGFDLSTINTIAKDKDGNYYGVRTYGNTFDTTSFKTFYKIEKEEYDEVAKDCFMVFKRLDGFPFEIKYAKIGINNISDDQPYYGNEFAGPIFTEVQFRHHMAYREGFDLNSRPYEVAGQEELTWSITLKKDWVIEPQLDFADNSTPDYAYVYYNVVIDGNGHKIYRNDDRDNGVLLLGSGLFGQDVPVRSATLKNVTIDGGGKYFGIDVSSKGILNLENVKIQNCYTNASASSSYGGGVRLTNDSTLTMDENTIFENCSANMGGAIRLYQNNNTVEINGSKFINNQADLGGAICALKKNNTININGATFDSNKAVKTIDGQYLQGGAIYSSSPLNIKNTDFNNNISAEDGGAIVAFADVTLKDGTFSNNESKADGGAITQGKGNFEIDGTIFKNNNSTGDGGAIYAYGDTKISGANFAENKSKDSKGGAIYQSKGELDVENSTFKNNSCKVQGGAVYVGSNSKASFKENIKFIKNESQNGGGAIYIHWSNNNEVEVANCEFQENSSSNGGAIYLNVRSKLTVEKSKFINNQAAFGGSISSGTYLPWIDDKCKLTINESTFDNNQALSGAGVHTAFPTEIKDSIFTKNEAQVHPKDDQKNPHISGVGGAVYVMFGETNIDACKFTENNAYGSGGAIGINGVARDDDGKITGIKDNIKVNVKGATVFEKNYCLVGQGGAIYTIPYLYDIEGYDTAVPEANLKAEAYKNLSTAADTVFKGNVALSGFFNPPANYDKYTNLAFDRNSFKDLLPNQDLAKSLLNNYDVNFKNVKVTAFFDPNEGKFKDGEKPKDIRVVKEDKDREITLLDAPNRAGYKFTGWKCSMNIPEEILKGLPEELLENLNEGKIFKAGDKFKLDAEYIFIAQWEKVEPQKPDEPKKPHDGGKTYFMFIPADRPLLNIKDHAQYMIGYIDTTFRPENNMTREEVAVMFSRLLKNPPTKGAIYNYNFSDVDKDRWSITAISYMSQMGIIKGYPDGSFRPEASITRAEFASIATKFAELTEGNKTFNDIGKDHWAYDLVSRAATAGWIKGYPDGSFKPDNKITRAEVVSMTNLMLNRKADEKYVDNNLDKLLKYKDVSKNHWAYYKIFEATNGHDFLRQSNKIDEEWKDITNKSFVYDK